MIAEAALSEEGLEISGIVPLTPGDGLPARYRTLLLVSPDEPRFWEVFRASREARDGQPDPLDRWSARVLDRIAAAHGARALFPFGGPPWRPFLDWALRSGRAHPSPVTLLVHDKAGLFISYRGALAVDAEIAPDPRRSPCEACAEKPCRAACPAGALTPGGYALDACHAFLDTPAGADCLGNGCAVRRACPIGARRRQPAQSAFHMTAFHS